MKNVSNLKQRIAVVVMDVLLLAELTCSIFLAQQDMENMTAIFLRSFVPMALVTLVVAKICIRMLRSRTSQSHEMIG